MNKRRSRSHRRSRRASTRALFDKLNAGLLAGASLPPPAFETTSPFGQPLHSLEELTKPFSAGSLATLAVASAAVPPMAESAVEPLPVQPDFLARFAARRVKLPPRHRIRARESTPLAQPAAPLPVRNAGNESAYHPDDMGYTAWSFDPIAISGSQALQAETLYLAKLRLAQPGAIERIHGYLASFSSLGTFARLRCAVYDEQHQLVAAGPEQRITPAEYGQPQAALSLELEQALSLPPGLYTIGIHCVACEGHIAILCASGYRGAAYTRLGDSCRFAFGSFSSGFPRNLSQALLQPGQAYWLALS